MFVSFLVPVYNTEKYLDQCMASLLVQKGCPYEILLLDDGSAAPCAEICDKYASEYTDRVRVVHKKNEGLLMTRRRGFAEARGDWFVCVDSDDYISPNLLEVVVQTINETHADMVMYNFEYFDKKGIHTPSRLKLNSGVFEGEYKQLIYERRLLSVDVNMMWMRAIKRDILDYDTDYSNCGIRNMCEDAVQVLPLYTRAMKIAWVNVPLYYYRKGDESITSQISPAHWQAIHRSFVLEQPYVKLWRVSDVVQNKRYTKQMENICNHVRWLYRNCDEVYFPEMVRQVKEEAMFQECLEHYQIQYASSRYSAISMPVIAAAVNRNCIVFLKLFLKLERWLRGR